MALARRAIAPVASVSAGPPCGGLYLKPPSRGGLCEGVTTIPSARDAPSRPARRLWVKMAWLIAGVGVYRPFASITVATPLAANTSNAETQAGSDNPWVSRPRNNGPVIPAAARYSTMAWVIAQMWDWLNAPSSAEPRCPEVPNDTC